MDAETNIKSRLPGGHVTARALHRPCDDALGLASPQIRTYAEQVGPAVNGAVIHPGAAAEKQCYADI